MNVFHVQSGEFKMDVLADNEQGAARQAVEVWWDGERLGVLMSVEGDEGPMYFPTSLLVEECR